MKLSYMGGDIVTKMLNEAFGYNGWCLEVKNTTHKERVATSLCGDILKSCKLILN